MLSVAAEVFGRDAPESANGGKKHRPARTTEPLQERGFQTAFRLARRELLDAAIGRLQASTGEAIEALRRNLTCRGKPSIEISAARAILDNHWRSLELGELEDRVRQLEEAIKLREGGRR